jgi:hypothetical protein
MKVVDVGSDPDGFVLQWHYVKKQFEVEDVLTGEIIQVYDDPNLINTFLKYKMGRINFVE